MSLAPGSRLGAYEIISLLGAGGMGEVYRATDTVLKRQVALKILPPDVAANPERVARFQREAEVLAALNHPNIAHLYGLERSDGTLALVMELVEGPTLADRIANGPIPLDEALPIAKQIAEALEAAHEHGIIHRDLKPANVKVRSDGTVKVLDFGLAKVGSGPLPPLGGISDSPTLTSPVMTRLGVILGTAAYMSPEQAAGKEVDRRSDMWAFGVVLFEMLIGRPAFSGETVSHVIASVLRDEPSLAEMPPNTPPDLRRLLRRCLEKDPKRRLDSAAAAMLDLDESASTPLDPAPPPSSRRRAGLIVIASLLAGATVAGLVAWFLSHPTALPPARISRFTITPPSELPLRLSLQAAARDFAVAPDGSFLVYRAGDRGQLAIRWFDRLDATVVDGEDEIAMPFVSPDSRWIGFVNNALTLKKVAVTGGPAVTLAQLPVWPRGASWIDEGTIIVGTDSADTGLLRVPAGGGEPIVLTKPDRTRGEEGHILPSALPGGHAVLFTIGGAQPRDEQIAVLDLDSGKYTTLFRGGRDAQYLPSGHLVYMSGLAMTAVRFDPGRRSVVGDPVRVVDNLAVSPTSALNVVVTSAGTMILATGLRASPVLRRLVWVDRDGHETAIPAPLRPYESARLSPDGTALAVNIRDQENDLWMWSFARQTLTRLTFDADVDLAPVWTPDGRRIVFASARSGAYNVYSHAVDGTGADVRITSGPNTELPDSVTPDGAFVIAHEVRPQSKSDLVRFRLTPAVSGITTSDNLVQTPFEEWNGEVSPDGRFLAYQSTESGGLEVFVRPYPEVSTARWQVSSGGGREPVWTRGGRELFYVNGAHRVTSVAVDPAGATFHAKSKSTSLANTDTSEGSPWRTYDVTPDGQRVLIMKQDATQQDAPAAGFVVIQNWFEELKRLVPTK